MKYVLFLIAILLSTQALALNCAQAPSCEELGYSTQNNSNCLDDGYLICPFDSQYKKCVNFNCESLGFTKSEKSDWCGKLAFCPNDKSYTACKALCEIGDVYYADGTCGYAKDYDGKKIPVGVVYYVTDDGRHGKVINLKNLTRVSKSSAFDPTNPYKGDTNLYWGYQDHDVLGLVHYNSNMVNPLKNRAPDVYDGKGNTNKILATSAPKNCNYGKNTEEYYQYCIPQAAQAAHDFYPQEGLKNDLKVGQGQWYLPALGELLDLYGYDTSKIVGFRQDSSGAIGDIKKIINTTLSALKAKGVDAESLTDEYYWSSLEYDQQFSFEFHMSNGYRYNDWRKADRCVRASLAF